MDILFEIQKILLDQFEEQPFYARAVFKQFHFDIQIIGIVGARGIGKTTLLLKHVLNEEAKKRKALYVSADNIYFLENTLLALVDKLYKETDVRTLCIDEIHKYPNWNQELKNIADTYLNFKIVFTGSSSIDIIHSKFDLSRRVTLYHLHGFSFREYLEFYLGLNLPILTLNHIVKNHKAIANEINLIKILKYFKEYLRDGYYPFFKKFQQENEKFQAIENCTQKVIYEDIAILHALKTPTLSIIEKLFKFTINSAPGELSVYKLASLLGKDFENISEYIKYLQEAGLIRFIYPNKTGNAFLRNPSKIYPENTNLIYSSYLPLAHDSSIGKIRETFVVNQLQNADFKVYYSEQGDFIVNNMLFEVGGKNKNAQQIKGHDNAYILADNILTGSNKFIPLYLLGFLY